MKRTVKGMLFLLCVAIVIGCTSEYSKETDRMIQDLSSSIEQKDLQKAKELRATLGTRELSDEQKSLFQPLKTKTDNLEAELKKQELARKYDEAMNKAAEAQAWLENSIYDFEQLLKKQNRAESMDEYIKIEGQKTAMKEQRDKKIRERDYYLQEAINYQSQME